MSEEVKQEVPAPKADKKKAEVKPEVPASGKRVEKVEHPAGNYTVTYN